MNSRITAALLIISASVMTGCDNHIKYVEEHPSYEGYSYELEFNKDDGKNLKILHKTFLNNKYVETNITKIFPKAILASSPQIFLFCLF